MKLIMKKIIFLSLLLSLAFPFVLTSTAQALPFEPRLPGDIHITLPTSTPTPTPTISIKFKPPLFEKFVPIISPTSTPTQAPGATLTPTQAVVPTGTSTPSSTVAPTQIPEITEPATSAPLSSTSTPSSKGEAVGGIGLTGAIGLGIIFLLLVIIILQLFLGKKSQPTQKA